MADTTPLRIRLTDKTLATLKARAAAESRTVAMLARLLIEQAVDQPIALRKPAKGR